MGVDVIIFLAVGVEVMRRGPRHLHVAAAIWVGLVSVALGLLDGAVFLHPIVLAILPGTVIRLLVVTAVGAGAERSRPGLDAVQRDHRGRRGGWCLLVRGPGTGRAS